MYSYVCSTYLDLEECVINTQSAALRSDQFAGNNIAASESSSSSSWSVMCGISFGPWNVEFNSLEGGWDLELMILSWIIRIKLESSSPSKDLWFMCLQL